MKKIITLIFFLSFSFFIFYKIFSFDVAVYLICFASAVGFVFQSYWAHKLNIWLNTNNINDIPEGYGVWSEIFSKLYKSSRLEDKSKKELNLTLEQFIAAAEAMLDGVIAINQNNEILWCNKPAQSMLKISLKKNYKQPINYVFRNTAFSDHLETGEYDETVKILDQGTRKTIEIKVTPFRNNMRLITARDISQLISNEKIRKEFVSNFSHELKTPLTVIVGFLETLESNKSKIDKETLQIFSIMSNQALRMKKLLDDLLLLSNVESNQLQNRDEKIDVYSLFKKIKNEIALIDKKEHQINFSINKKINLKGSAIEVESAFTNLITNAIRYSEANKEIRVTWNIEAMQPTFTVKDSGIGISKTHLSRITERFYRIDSDRSRDTGGTGLGLSIVKNVITQHNGRLEIKSNLNQGSTFKLIFPKERIL
ncbi:MAG: phosphate regulon sensor histidine kinase PhoR [Methylophilaceae bacterium]|nr:phosphate regulon sensor histidine kinase PhoR [Methylophilaceae bacterium]MBL6729144.1 phosphate regulon sensor histidine kinase PhoR [Methylophilaceae bacterium]MBL6791657.1 phosphate regulon sensor histidine kinase PhoR [Methylophilaceae bacterium]